MWLPLSSRTGAGERLAQHVRGKQLEPRAGGVDQDAGGGEIAAAAHVEHQAPVLAPFRADAAHAGADHRPALACVESIEHYKARVIGQAIGILEAALGSPREGCTERIIGEIEGAGRRQDLPAAEMVIDEKPQAQHPRRAQARLGGKHEADRPDQVRRHPQHDFALDQRLAHQPQPSVLEIAQAPVDELGRGR